jgi:membrane-bound lytic murein transglycosylase B
MPRMLTRRLTALTIILACFCASTYRPVQAQTAEKPFATFVNELWPDAQAKGITRASFDLAMKGITPDRRVIAATQRQPEYGKPVGDYINALASKGRIARGIRKAKEWAKTFDAVEKKFEVERWVLLALWGMETDYGAAKDKWDVFRSLATLPM